MKDTEKFHAACEHFSVRTSNEIQVWVARRLDKIKTWTKALSSWLSLLYTLNLNIPKYIPVKEGARILIWASIWKIPETMRLSAEI